MTPCECMDECGMNGISRIGGQYDPRGWAHYEEHRSRMHRSN